MLPIMGSGIVTSLPQPIQRTVQAALGYFRRLSFKAFGNDLGIFGNLRYFLFHAICRTKNKTRQTDSTAAKYSENLRQRGYILVENVDLSKISEGVEKYFSIHKPTLAHQPIDQSLHAELAGDIAHALKQVAPIIESYYGSPFQVYNVLSFRATPSKTDPESSYWYHVDNCPKSFLKVFFYLTDQDNETGAFRCFDYQTTRKLLRSGFNSSFDRKSAQRFITPNLINEKQLVLSGKKNTVLIWDNFLVHKGTLPMRGHRDLLQMQVFPAMQAVDLEKNIRNAAMRNRKESWPRDPFQWQPESAP